jgi:glutamate--cysteine ligase
VRLGNNQHRTAARGREPGLTLDSGRGGDVPLQDWAAQLLVECMPIAETVAQVLGDERYVQAVAAARRSLQQPDSLPSARVLDTMTRDFEQSYVRFARAQSQATRARLMVLPYTADLQARFEAQARQSLARQEEIEAGDSMPFEIYRQQYLAPARLGA